MLPGILVQRLVELPDELFEDRAHRRVVDIVRVETHFRIPELLDDQEQETRLVELGDRVVKVELLQHLAHVRTEPRDVVAQVLGNVGSVGQQLLEVVPRRVVEGEPGGAPQLRVEILDLATQAGLDLKHLRLGGSQHGVEPAQHGQRQDHVLIFAALERVADQVRHAPEEADDLAVIHGRAAANVAAFSPPPHLPGWARFPARAAVPLRVSRQYVYDFYHTCDADSGARMKKKLTITVDDELLPRAKRYARSRGVSLSSLIEASLREIAAEDTPSFASRWKGRFEAAGRDDDRYRALARKHL